MRGRRDVGKPGRPGPPTFAPPAGPAVPINPPDAAGCAGRRGFAGREGGMGLVRVARLALLLGAAVAVVGCGRNCVPAELAKSKNLVDLSQPPDAHAPVPRGAERGLADVLRDRDG